MVAHEGAVWDSSARTARVVMDRDVLFVVLGMERRSLNTAGWAMGAV